MSKFEVTGRLHIIYAAKQVTDRMTKREFSMIIEPGKYEQIVAFELVNDKCSLIDGYQNGDEVTVSFNLRGREWRKPGTDDVKHFISLAAWKVEPVQKSAGGKHNGAPPSDLPRDAPAGAVDDIPFLSCSLADEPSPIAAVIRGGV